MQKQRQVHGWTGKRVATEFGCSASHITRVEQGKNRPSLELVQFYEQAFACEGVLLSLFAPVQHNDEQARRRVGGHRPQRVNAVPGDSSTFVIDSIPHGTTMEPGQIFTKTWTIHNSGQIPWVGRQLERQGPLTAPGLITSQRHVPIPNAEPGETITIEAVLKAPTYDSTSIAYFKMVTSDSELCFPSTYQLGLDVLVRVTGQLPDTDPS